MLLPKPTQALRGHLGFWRCHLAASRFRGYTTKKGQKKEQSVNFAKGQTSTQCFTIWEKTQRGSKECFQILEW